MQSFKLCTILPVANDEENIAFSHNKELNNKFI